MRPYRLIFYFFKCYLDRVQYRTCLCCPMGLGIIALTWIQKKSSAGLRTELDGMT